MKKFLDVGKAPPSSNALQSVFDAYHRRGWGWHEVCVSCVDDRGWL